MATNIRRLAQILAEDGNFRVGLIRKESDSVVHNLDNHTDFVAEAAATDDLDVVTDPEPLAQTLVGHVNGPSGKITLGDLQCDNVALHIGSFTDNTLLFALIHLDDVTRHIRNTLGAVLESSSQSLEIEVLCTVLGSAGELGDFLQRGVDILDLELLDLDVLDLETVLEIIAVVVPAVGLGVTLEVTGVLLASLGFTEQTLGRARAGYARALALAVSLEDGVIPDTVVESGNETDAGLEAVFCNVDDLSEITGVLGRLLQTNPGTGLQVGRLDDTQEVGHVLDLNKVHVAPGINVENAIESNENIVLSLSLNVDVSLHDRVDTTTLESSRDGHLVLGAHSLFNTTHNREDNLTLLSFLTPDSPDAGILDTGEQQATGHDGHISVTSGRGALAVALTQDLCLFLSIEAGLHLSTTVELAVSPIIVEAAAVGNIVRVGIVDEVLYFFTVTNFVFSLVFVIDFGFDIEESSSTVLVATLASVTLETEEDSRLARGTDVMAQVGRFGGVYAAGVAVVSCKVNDG